jgi:hypothetical protein
MAPEAARPRSGGGEVRLGTIGSLSTISSPTSSTRSAVETLGEPSAAKRVLQASDAALDY